MIEIPAGTKYGELTVIKRHGYSHGEATWLCVCSCGNTCEAKSYALRTGVTKHCGCMRGKNISKATKKLPEYDKSIRSIWVNMMTRCYNTNSKYYYRYGGRGIAVCDDWHTFQNFAEWSIVSGWKKGLTLDRVDNDGDYKPSNCRFATKKEQANNRSTSRYVTVNGITRTLANTADFYNIKYYKLRRLLERGFSPDVAVLLEKGGELL